MDVYPTADGRAVQDLKQADFEVFEDGKPQEIRTFEHVVVDTGGPQETRSEPSNVRESQEMVGDPRARLFVLFLDTYHVSRDGAWTVRRSISRLLEKVIGQNDFVAVMTPEMSAGAVTFTRRTGTIDELLDKWITWGKRHEEVMNPDPVESRYQFCYPPQPGEGSISAIAQEMTARRREQMTLDAMRDLIVHLAGLREERKAILMVSEGWALYRPNSSLARPVDGRIPGPQPVGVGVNGGLQMGDPVPQRGRRHQPRVRYRSHDARAGGSRPPVPRAARRGEPRQCQLLHDRPARPAGVRLADLRAAARRRWTRRCSMPGTSRCRRSRSPPTAWPS